MKKVQTIGTVLMVTGALGVLSASAGSRMNEVRIAAADTEHAAEGAAPTGAAKAKIGDEVRCAIDGMKMPLSADTPTAEHAGKTYYFCGDSEKKMFLEHPERYIGH